MNQSLNKLWVPTQSWLIVFGLSLFGVLTHLIPHEMGVSTVGVVGILAAAYLPRKLVLLPVFLTVFIVDAINGFYALLAMSFVYLGHVGAAYAAKPFLGRVRPRTLVEASFASAGVFYLVSNLTPMAMKFYPWTVAGWADCYVNAVPFLFRGILANILFCAVCFGVIWVVRELHAHRIAAAQRN